MQLLPCCTEGLRQMSSCGRRVVRAALSHERACQVQLCTRLAVIQYARCELSHCTTTVGVAPVVWAAMILSYLHFTHDLS